MQVLLLNRKFNPIAICGYKVKKDKKKKLTNHFSKDFRADTRKQAL